MAPMAARGCNNTDNSSSIDDDVSDAAEPGSVVWECVVDVRALTALPEGSRLSHLWTLPADCLLVEMSNGGLYAPGFFFLFLLISVLRVFCALCAFSMTKRPGRGRGEWVIEAWDGVFFE